MANLTFTYRSDTPASRRIFQENRARFLQLGAIRIDDGFVTDELGRTTTYAVLRPLAFTDPSIPYRSSLINPGDRGLTPLQFRRGRVSVLPPQSKQVLLTSSPTHQFLNGRVTVVGVVAGGLLTDFAVWNATQQDPADFYVESATDLDSGGVTQPWTRNNAIFVPHKNARYLAVGTKAYNLTNSGIYRNHYVKKWMVEKTEVGRNAPTAKYGKAREVVVKVRPQRINLAINGGFEAGTGALSSSQATLAVSTVWKQFGTQSLRITPTNASNADSYASLASISSTILKPGRTYTVSAYHHLETALNTTGSDPRGRRIVLYFFNASNGVVGEIRGNQAPNEDGNTTRLSVTFTVPATAARTDIRLYNGGLSGSGDNFWDGVLIERGSAVGEYFDGSTSADTIWEGTTGQSRSYLYKNRVDRYAAIQRVLEDNVPLGIGIAEPVFGFIPSDW